MGNPAVGGKNCFSDRTPVCHGFRNAGVGIPSFIEDLKCILEKEEAQDTDCEYIQNADGRMR
jgi:hypothetical protein